MLKFASLSIANKTKKLLAILVATIIAFSTFVGILPLNLIAGALPDGSDFKSTEVYATDFSSDDASTWKMANANNNIESGKLSLTAVGTDVYSSVAMRTEERNEQYIRATFNTSDFTNARPVIWARATYLEEGNPESIVGYYLVFKKNNDIQLWKRSLVGSNYEDSFIAYCGAVNWDNNKQYVLEMNITGTDCAVINVRVFKATTYLQGRQTVVDNTNPHLQGGAGVSVCGTAANAIGKFSAFDYYSTDNFNKYYYAYENGVKTGVSFAQTIALNKDTEYTLSVEVEDAADYEPLVISYATTNASTGAHILIDLDDCVLTENNGKKVYSYKFKLSDQSTAPLNYYDQRFANSDYRTTPVFVGFRQSNASIKNRYTKFQVCENLSNGTLGPNLLVNGDFKLGLYGWSDHLDTAFGSSYSYGAVGDTDSKNSSCVKIDTENPVIEEVVTEPCYTSATATATSIGDDNYTNVTLIGEERTNQYVALDYKFDKKLSPSVWARAKVTSGVYSGYYVSVENTSTSSDTDNKSVKVYKRTSNGTSYIGAAGNVSLNGNMARLEIITEQINTTTTKISVFTYKASSTTNVVYKLMTANTFYDSTEELQVAGKAGYAVNTHSRNASSGLSLQEGLIKYGSKDGVDKNELTYVRNSLTGSSNTIAGQKVSLDPAKTYTVSARTNSENKKLSVCYLPNSGNALETYYLDVGAVGKDSDDYRTVTYTFCLNDIIDAEDLPIAKTNDGYEFVSGSNLVKTAQVFIGFTNSDELCFDNLSVKDADGKEAIVNSDYTYGLLGWISKIDTSKKWGYDPGYYDSSSIGTTGLTLATASTQTEYDAMFKVISSDDEPDYTLTTELKGTNDYTLDTTNLIYGINPIEGASVPRFTDGNKQCLPAGMTQLSFPLVESVKINEIRVISQNGYAGKASRLAAYDIYIADTKDDLYKEENKVATFNTDSTATDYVAAIDTFEFSSTYDTKGKYVGFKVTKTDNSNMNKVHIIELEVYGTGGGSVNPGDDAEFAPRPVLENINNNFEFNSGEVSVQGGRGSIDNLYISQEAHTNQCVQLDYTYNKAIIPYVWAKAICSTTNNKSVTGYYACIENGTSVKLYKRTYDAANNTMVDTEIGPCGNATLERIVRLEIVTEKAGNATKITVTAYKTGSSDGRFKLMTKNTYFDSTPELQTPGYAGYSVKGFGSTADVKNFSFCSSDGTTATLSYLENPVTKNAGGIAGQKVIINPTKTYTLTARVSAVNTQLALYYLNADGKLEQGFKAVGNVSNVDGYRTVTFTFCLNDLIAQESLVAPKNDKYAYGDGLAQVFVGFVTDKAKVISYSNLSLVEKDTGNQMLVNQDFTMGIYGWAEAITNYWAFETGNYGETSTTQYGRLNLKTNVSQADYDKIFKMASGEQGDIDLSKYDKLMVHITGDGVEYTKLGQILYLEPNTKYVYEVDFGYQPRKSARPLIFFHTVEDTKITYSKTKCIEPTYKLYKEGSRTKYVFSVPEKAYVNSETGKVTAFIGLSSGETGANCYFANFTVYKESDSNKTNLFKNADFKEGFKYWNINANYQWSQLSAISVLTYKQPGSGIELLPYDASKIKLDDETLTVPDIPDFEYDNYKGEYMVYIPETVTSTYGKLGQIHYLEKGVTYNFSMLYKYIRQNSTKQVIFYFTDDPHASNDYIISKGYTNAKGEADKSKYIAAIRKKATFDMTMDETNSRISIDFKVPSEAWKNSEGKAPMFVGISTGELGTKCYFAKLTLTKEGSKENIFTNADFKKGFLDWSIGYGYLMEPVTQNGVFFTAGYTVAQLLPFDDTIFVNDTNDNLWNDGEWFSIFGADDKIASNDSSVENASTEYKTVTVKGKLNVPATIALYSGIAVVLVGGSFGTVFAIKKKKIK